jgi:hypothetical protein
MLNPSRTASLAKNAGAATLAVGAALYLVVAPQEFGLPAVLDASSAKEWVRDHYPRINGPTEDLLWS